MKYKAIFIDIDDTLLDYIPCCREAFDAAMNSLSGEAGLSVQRSVSDNGLSVEDGLSGSERAEQLTRWMEQQKPYLNPEFKLMDLRAVLPMNRTYLSQFINDTYGCSFYQFVNRYRIEEAQRLMREHPDMRLSDVATRSGFSSRRVFSQIFTREAGTTPTEWK